MGFSFVLRPSFLVGVSALEGHQKLARRATMTFPELTLRSAGRGYQKLLSEVVCKAAPESCCSKKVLIKVVLESLSKLLPKAVPRSCFPKLFHKASLQSGCPKAACFKPVPQSTSPKLFSKAAPESCSPQLLPKASESCPPKLRSKASP